mmetsp:Transcript_16401/g.33813  ORF Transcript_16401/g.33813 Transcript_16401/m.33813 type:complete len:477 (-) Transcript_16401:75-1505(-)
MTPFRAGFLLLFGTMALSTVNAWVVLPANQNSAIHASCLHSSVVSPRMADASIEDDDFDEVKVENLLEQQEKLEQSVDLGEQQEKLLQLLELLNAEPRYLLRFQDDESGVRGIYLNRSVEKEEIVLKLPIESCLTDDDPPEWLSKDVMDDPDRWATRLAASWIDSHLNENIPKPQKLWFSLLPDPEYLRASLPVHWPETTVSNARSTALELAVDSAFFARAEAVSDLVQGMEEQFELNEKRANELAHHALDLVQTRSCRLQTTETENCKRAMAPIFDFINHGSRNVGSANACFSLEDGYLVVRSMRDMEEGEEVKIDYGASARPAWKCLLSYGFVSQYKRTLPDADEGENLAEVYMKGVRYEVADDSVPIDMVADANPLPWSDEEEDSSPMDATVLTPEVALRIAERIADAAFYLLLEPEQILDETEDDSDSSPFEVISTQLAASLRWSQHRILLTCAAGLTHFAKENVEEESSYQ